MKPVKKVDAFARARVPLLRGMPHRWVAAQFGVHRNTVLAWARRLGLSAASGDRASARRINAALRHVRRLPARERAVLLDKLGRGRAAA